MTDTESRGQAAKSVRERLQRYRDYIGAITADAFWEKYGVEPGDGVADHVAGARAIDDALALLAFPVRQPSRALSADELLAPPRVWVSPSGHYSAEEFPMGVEYVRADIAAVRQPEPREGRWRESGDCWECPACGSVNGQGVEDCSGHLLDDEDGGDTRHAPVARPPTHQTGELEAGTFIDSEGLESLTCCGAPPSEGHTQKCSIPLDRLLTAESELQEALQVMRGACLLLSDDLGVGDGKTLRLEKVVRAYTLLFDFLHTDPAVRPASP